MTLQFINNNTGTLKNAVFCFTGKSPKPRNEMRNIALDANAGLTQSVTRDTTILVAADPNSNSTKVQKAKQFGLDIISNQQFFDMCACVTHSNGGNPISQIHIQKPELTNKQTNKRKHSIIRHIQL